MYVYMVEGLNSTTLSFSEIRSNMKSTMLSIVFTVWILFAFTCDMNVEGIHTVTTMRKMMECCAKLNCPAGELCVPVRAGSSKCICKSANQVKQWFDKIFSKRD